MFNQLEQRPSTKKTKTFTRLHVEPTSTPSPGRLIQVGVALYLLPALVVVLAVSALGILVVWAREFVCGSIGAKPVRPGLCRARDLPGVETVRAEDQVSRRARDCCGGVHHRSLFALAIEWYKRALEATVLWNVGLVAGIEVGGAPFFLRQAAANGSESPTKLGVT